MNLIFMRGINKIYTQGDVSFQALFDINFEVKKGEFVSILGPSGSGKSTLMNLIGLLDFATSGEYFLEYEEVSSMSAKKLAKTRNRKIGFIFQNFNLLQRQNALENVMLPMIYAKIPSEERVERAGILLDRVGLTDKMKNYPRQLSGGQQQRIAIARALANDPAVILADEPTGALDQRTGRQIIDMLKDLNESEGKTILIITHDVEIAKEAKRTVRILDGRLYQE
ncbi:MAG TPA: ABC transporter ATP-binding protein [Eubacteriales bacterium]|jgi:putative ABC transport system ATP-binding protein|nr:ABC transporter ATP-binding protein [Clostridia bacterium]HRR89818.1 ABC transporter ATP-binding protein [Eubacteriales bacterium]